MTDSPSSPDNGPSGPQFTNRIGQYLDDTIFDLEDVDLPVEAMVEVPESFYRQVSDLHKQARELLIENRNLRETVRSLDLDCRAAEIDLQAARYQLAQYFAAKLKRIWRKATQ